MNYTRLLTIAGSDSGGGAGIQADLKTFSALGGYGCSVVTALTAQNTVGVQAVHPVPVAFVRHQLDAVATDIGVDALKIGMLGEPALIECIADGLKAHGLSNMVLDPVMVATSGDRLLPAESVDALREKLLPMATLITPNVPEAEVLLGTSLSTEAGVELAARQLVDMGAQAALIKGGHFSGVECNDGLAWRGPKGMTFMWVRGERVASRNTHGTGCTLSAACCAYLGQGRTIPDAVIAAKTYVEEAIRKGADYTLGDGHGPVHHFHSWWK